MKNQHQAPHPTPITNHAKSLYALYWDNKPNLLLLEDLKVHRGEILLIREMIFPNDQVVSLLNGKPHLGYWVGSCGMVRNASASLMMIPAKGHRPKSPKVKDGIYDREGVFTETAGNPYSCGWCCALVKNMTNP